MLGCSNLATMSISARNRSAETVAACSSRSTLIATRRPVSTSCATYTCAAPPEPRLDFSRYVALKLLARRSNRVLVIQPVLARTACGRRCPYRLDGRFRGFHSGKFERADGVEAAVSVVRAVAAL